MSEVKSKLQSSYDRDDVAFVENLFEQKNFQDATKVSLKVFFLYYRKLTNKQITGSKPTQSKL